VSTHKLQHSSIDHINAFTNPILDDSCPETAAVPKSQSPAPSLEFTLDLWNLDDRLLGLL